MLPLHLLDDDTVEALLAGRPVAPGLAPLAGAVGELRAAARQPVRPSAELTLRLASGDFSGISPAPLTPEPAPRRLRTWLTGASPRVRVVSGAVLVFTAFTAATAAGALPGGAQQRMESFIETVTPISFQRDEPDPVDVEDGRGPASDPERPATTEPDDSGPAEDPGSPVTPSPGKPETPPGKPDSPGNPDKPDPPAGKPDEPPGKPDAPPGKPDAPPGKPDDPGHSERPDRPDAPPGRPDSPGQSDPPGQSSGDGPGNSGGAGDSENSHGTDGSPGNGNRPDRSTGPDR